LMKNVAAVWCPADLDWGRRRSWLARLWRSSWGRESQSPWIEIIGRTTPHQIRQDWKFTWCSQIHTETMSCPFNKRWRVIVRGIDPVWKHSNPIGLPSKLIFGSKQVWLAFNYYLVVRTEKPLTITTSIPSVHSCRIKHIMSDQSLQMLSQKQ
jgi:hypothetical protein